MPAPDESADTDALVALSVLDGEDSGSSFAAKNPDLVAQLENVQQIISALGSMGPADSSALTPPPVPTWGPYLLKEQIGKGSFGVVCRGFDPAVAREIAVKLYSQPNLPSEPRLMARVHHRNVVAVFGAAVHDGRPGIWMELIRGRTLAERVQAEGPLPVSEVVRIGIEVCRALEAIHDARLVHRDVKARNVMEKDDGGIVVMDLGAGAAQTSGHDGSPLVTGTPLYMAPEVVLGERATPQSDIYSVGVLLYYLLTGTYPVNAKTWDELHALYARPRSDGPSAVRRLQQLRPDAHRRVARCAETALYPTTKRYASATELREALESIRHPELRPWRRLTWMRQPGYVAALALVLVAGIGLGLWTASLRTERTTITLKRLTWDSGLTTDPVRSPDGRLVAYASDRSAGNLDIWIEQIVGGMPVRLTNDPADDAQPWFSPDGSQVVFRSERDGGGIYAVSALGGPARLIVRDGLAPRFSPDGQWISYIGANKAYGAAFVTPASGGTVFQLPLTVQAETTWSGDGKHLLLTGRTAPDNPDWWVVSISPNGPAAPIRTGAFALLGRHAMDVFRAWPTPWQWVGNRVLFHARQGDATNLWEIELSPTTFQVRGEPRRLTVSSEDQLQPSLGADDQLLFATRNEVPYISELPLDGNTGVALGSPRPLMSHYPNRGLHALSRDGRWLAFTSARPGHPTLLLRDLQTGAESPLTAGTTNAEVEYCPVMSPDGTRLIYATVHEGRWSVRGVATSGGIPEQFCTDCGPPTGWSPDGRYALVQHGVGGVRLGVLDLESKRVVEIIHEPGLETYRAGFSPDGKWISFHSGSHSGATREYVAPFRGLARLSQQDWIPITEGTGWSDVPRWSPDGNLLYYVSDRDGFMCLWAQRLEPATKIPAGPPFAVLHVHGRKHSIGNVNVRGVDMSVAQNKILFTMGELSGSVWLAQFQ